MAKLSLYAYKDNQIGVFRNPLVYDRGLEDLKIELKTSLKDITQEAALKLAGNSLYFLGTFDTTSGEIVPANEFCFDVGPIAMEMAALAALNREAMESVKDVKKVEVVS